MKSAYKGDVQGRAISFLDFSYFGFYMGKKTWKQNVRGEPGRLVALSSWLHVYNSHDIHLYHY